MKLKSCQCFRDLNELFLMYKLMEKREMNEVETQFKVKGWNKLNGFR